MLVFFLLLMVGCSLTYIEVSLFSWTLFVWVILGTVTLTAESMSFFLALLYFLVVCASIVLNFTALRVKFISRPLHALFRSVLPPISSTEKEAIQAGNVGWEKTLFSGMPDWKALSSLPVPTLSEEETAFLEDEVNELCGMLNDWEITHRDYDLPDEVWQFLKDKRFFGMIIPKEYDGLGFSALAHSNVIIKIASRSISAAVTVMVPNSLGPAELIMAYGSQKQKDVYLPKLAKGDEIPCFALTGPRAGSDAGSIPDKGIVCKQTLNGKEVLGVKINWDKRYITLAPVATLIGLAFHLYDPDHIIGASTDRGITLALIPRHTQGVSIGRRHFPVNQAFMNGPILGKDVFIPLDSIIGGLSGVGKGWRMLMESLGAGRAISLPALSVSAVKLMSRSTGGYAALREQFHHPISDFEGIKEMLAEMAGNTYVMEAMRIMALAEVEAVGRPSVVSAMAKYHLTEKMRAVVNHAMDVQGGSAICMGPKNIWARIYQSIPVSITVEGANILTRNMIIFGQGSMRCHPYLLQEMESCQSDKDHDVSKFDAALWQHGRYFLRNMSRSFILGVSRGVRFQNLRRKRNDEVVMTVDAINRLSASFAFLTDILFFMYGGKLKIKERLSGRMADAFSELYMASAVLKKYQAKKMTGSVSAAETALFQWAMSTCLDHTRQAISAVIRNFSSFWIRMLVTVVIFPLGKFTVAPVDKLQHRVAAILTTPSRIRDELTEGIYRGQEDDTLAIIDSTLSEINKMASEMQAIRDMKYRVTGIDNYEEIITMARNEGVISEELADRLRKIEKDRDEVIRVDDFPADMFENNDKRSV